MSTPSETEAICGILRACEAPAIIELGGHEGEDTAWMTRVVADRNPKVVVLEADEENYRKILGAGLSALATIVFGAIAAESGTCDFWKCNAPAEGRGSGSIRKPTGHVVEKPWYDFQKLPKQIPCFSLDDVYERHGFDHVDLLWVDVQGAERDMIAGGANALKHSNYLFIEAEERELYEGQALRPELLGMLPDWMIIGRFEHNLLLKNLRT